VTLHFSTRIFPDDAPVKPHGRRLYHHGSTAADRCVSSRQPPLW
jgi:hypothetical protein